MMMYLMSMIEDESDRRLFAAIYQAHHAALERAALGILHNAHDAEGAVQNAWLQILRHFSAISQLPDGEIRYYLLAVVKNEALMLLRKNRNTVELEDWAAVVADLDESTGYQDIAALFARLPETYWAALEMKLLLDYSNKEIAQHLGLSETAVSTRIQRGRKLLQKFVEEEGLS